ncbi:MAG: hypothetical protein NVS2B3_19330 [Vulcanimicrobiaceae bacterium]
MGRLEALVSGERERVRGLPVERTNEFALVRLDEIRASCALAGVTMAREECAALVDRGLVLGTRALAQAILVADYADAAAYVSTSAKAGSRRRFVAVAEIMELHRRALRRVDAARPGEVRRATVPAFASGMVALPAWLVPRELAAFADRVGSGPPPGESELLWLANAYERFLRIQPFASGNGRVGRLVLDLVLRRLGFPPFVLAARDRARFAAALRDADARDHVPLATLLGRSLLVTQRRLHAAVERLDRPEPFEPLIALAAGRERDALYKAAQRGRLHAIRRDGTLMTTREHIAAYRASRAPSGRRA